MQYGSCLQAILTQHRFPKASQYLHSQATEDALVEAINRVEIQKSDKPLPLKGLPLPQVCWCTTSHNSCATVMLRDHRHCCVVKTSLSFHHNAAASLTTCAEQLGSCIMIMSVSCTLHVSQARLRCSLLQGHHMRFNDKGKVEERSGKIQLLGVPLAEGKHIRFD